MFDPSLLFREAHKPDLADAIWVLIGPDVRADIPNKTVGMYWTGRGHSCNGHTEEVPISGLPEKNKQRFIFMLSEELTKKNC